MKAPIYMLSRRRAGFTLTELLVVVLIIIILATLSVTVTGRIKLSAAKTRGMGQMRNIGVAAMSYSADKGFTEPFYASTNADYWNEAGPGSKPALQPGNPARALYNFDDPASGYIQDPADFFSPLCKIEPPKTKGTYNPNNASSTNPWGTYAWFYPFVTSEFVNEGKATGPVVGLTGLRWTGEPANLAIQGRYMMSEGYPSTYGPMPGTAALRFGKKYYHALMNDGSVQYVGEEAAYLKWRRGS